MHQFTVDVFTGCLYVNLHYGKAGPAHPKKLFSAPNSSIGILGNPTQVLWKSVPSLCLPDGNCVSLPCRKAVRMKAQTLFQGDLSTLADRQSAPSTFLSRFSPTKRNFFSLWKKKKTLKSYRVFLPQGNPFHEEASTALQAGLDSN